MKVCPSCGAQNQAENRACVACGFPFEAPRLAQTMVGHAPLYPPAAPAPDAAAAPPPAPAPGAAQPGPRSTLLGIAPIVPIAPPAPAPVPEAPPQNPYAAPPPGPRALGGTMIGMAPIAPPAGAAPAAPTAPAEPKPSLKGTIVGMAPPPGFLGSVPPVPPPPEVAPPLGGTVIGHAPFPPPPEPAVRTGPKTLLGVARPGIAPLFPGQEAPPPAPAAPAGAPPYGGPSYGPSGVPPVSPPVPSSRKRPEPRVDARKRRIPLGAAIAIVAAAALLTAAVVALLLYDPRGMLSAEIKLDAEGQERLEITCPKCSDSASVRLGDVSARFQGQRAGLPLKAPLAIGENQLELELERTPGKSEKVELNVPVEFRVRADTSLLDEAKPRVRVVVQAVPGTTAVVDGQPVKLGPDGSGSVDLDVTNALEGEEETVKRLERRVPYAITPPGSSTQSGEVSFELGIAALTIDAPGDSVVIDTPTFVLAGRTLKGASITVEGRPITVDAFGKFAQMMNVSALGETTVTVRASAPNQAPRLVPVKVKRVADLGSEVAKARASAVGSYDEIAGAPEEKRGVLVALDGTVIEARTENFASVVLLDVKSGCAKAPCLLRVTYGARTQFASGDRVTAVGKVTGAVDGPRENTRVPAVSAEFVVKAGK